MARCWRVISVANKLSESKPSLGFARSDLQFQFHSIKSTTRGFACSSHQHQQNPKIVAEAEHEQESEEKSENQEKEEEADEVNEDGEIVNRETGEVGGPRGPEPTRYGDWERRGRCSDF
ncbi:hypothetical protein Scep_006031 [Stephania cephalantha]|uniref:Succinate dehydrogenase assembly factor 4, mitochondrial n=1 Tax=Stephania cephalantha TaxID=152367 RepID=A0AAP0K950_9MAGN